MSDSERESFVTARSHQSSSGFSVHSSHSNTASYSDHETNTAGSVTPTAALFSIRPIPAPTHQDHLRPVPIRIPQTSNSISSNVHVNAAATPAQPHKPRLASLDVFRGLVTLAMIVANYQIEEAAFPVLLHPDWFGFSLADAVFPSFLFIMGVAIPISMQSGRKSYATIAIRALKLAAIGLLLNNPISALLKSPHTLSNFRIPGVLQRTGIVFYIVATAYKSLTSPYMFTYAFPAFLLAVWTIMSTTLIPTAVDTNPPCPMKNSTEFSYFSPPECTAQSNLDLLAFSRAHTYKHLPFDNEGILSTFPACVTCVIGCIAGQGLLRAFHGRDFTDGSWRLRHAFRLSIAAIVCLLGAFALSAVGVPVSKNLWTPSFVGIAGAVSLAGFVVCFLWVDCGVRDGGADGFKKWVKGLMRTRVESVDEDDADDEDTFGSDDIEHARFHERDPLLGSSSPASNATTVTRAILAPPPPPPNQLAHPGFNTLLSSCGKNPLALYVFSEVLAEVLQGFGVYTVLFDVLFASWIWPGGLASLVWSLFWAVGVVGSLGVYLDRIQWYWRM
ncbi:heparan-alpha-glucosaminide N-acetyltransferase [Chytriomyces confervae]|uniref:Heparan-alpha-glucosaminide N-acetyltransferase n=1 Tax=Chytriomyces confervae TaxID=246404 RepID=A0A507EKX3_9FUNG|nr:heparan-alpha-glucosaminide N-acetyltransferase [Chytriomyces confervae]